MSDVTIKRDRLTAALAGFLVLVGSLTFAVAGDAPHVLVLAVLGIGWSLLMRKPLRRTTRTLVYSSVLVMTSTVLQDQILPVSSDKFFLGPAALLCPLLLYAAVALLFFAEDETGYCAIIAAVLFATMAAGSRMLWGAARESVTWFGGVSPEFHTFYAVMVALEIGTLLILLGRIEPRRICSRPGGRPWLWRLGIIGVAVILVAGSVVGLRIAARVYEKMMSRMFGEFLNSYFVRRFNWVIFPDDVDLWRTVPFAAAKDREIVLRAQSPVSPGYLRGRTYQTYFNGRWRTSREQHSLAVREAGGRLVFSVYTRNAAGSGADRGIIPPTAAVSYPVDVLVADHYRSDVLLAGGGATEFALSTRTLSEDRNGTLLPQDWDRRAGYSYRFQPGVAYPAPAPPEPGDYLAVPPELKPQLAAWLGEAPQPDAEVDAVPALVDWTCRRLQEQCVYALDVHRNRRSDPVRQFLFDQRRGHCELFAAAAALLLRTQGIPARYVTGFVCDELHPSGRYWLARLRDAHAWAEAWDAAAGRWVIVEATPGNGIPHGAADFTRWSALLDRWIYVLQSDYVWLKRGYMAEIIVQAMQWTGQNLAQWFGNPWVGSLLLFSVLTGGGTWVMIRRRRRERDPLLSEPRRQLCREWASCEKHLARLGEGRRDPAWTLREFSLRSGWSAPERAGPGSGENATILAALVRDYERLRYQARLPSPEELAAFGDRVRKACQGLKKPRR